MGVSQFSVSPLRIHGNGSRVTVCNDHGNEINLREGNVMAGKSNLFDAPVRVPAGALELAGFRRWTNSPSFPERGRISFLDGEMEIDMNAKETHATT